jgi:hypothetical protein
MSHGADLATLHRETASYVDRILRDTKLGDLPVHSRPLESCTCYAQVRVGGIACRNTAPTQRFTIASMHYGKSEKSIPYESRISKCGRNAKLNQTVDAGCKEAQTMGPGYHWAFEPSLYCHIGRLYYLVSLLARTGR